MSLPVTCQAGFQLLGLTFAGQRGGVMLRLQVTPVRQDRGLASKTASNTHFISRSVFRLAWQPQVLGLQRFRGEGSSAAGRREGG